MEIIVRAPERGRFLYWVGSLLAQLPLIAESGTGRPTEDRNTPTVIARSRSGESHVLLRTGTYKQAVRAKQRFQREFDAVGEQAFHAKYGLRPIPEPRTE